MLSIGLWRWYINITINFVHYPSSCLLFKTLKYRTMDNVQNCECYINILSSQTYKPYIYLLKCSFLFCRIDYPKIETVALQVMTDARTRVLFRLWPHKHARQDITSSVRIAWLKFIHSPHVKFTQTSFHTLFNGNTSSWFWYPKTSKKTVEHWISTFICFMAYFNQ
jgi:hypothetical protein